MIDTTGFWVHVLLVKKRVMLWDSARISPEKTKTVSAGAGVKVWVPRVRF